MKRGTKGPAVGRFFARHLKHRKGAAAGRPFTFEPWQQDFVNEFFEVDARGRRVYKYGYLGIPRGNGKTPLAAGFGLLELLTRHDSPDIFVGAGSKDQALILQDFARSFVEDDDRLRHWIKASRRFLACKENNGIMRVLSAEGALQYGLSVSAAFIDELHAFVQVSQEELFNALLTALHKRIDSYLLSITTAGYDKETILGRAYAQALALPGEDRLDGCLRIRRDRDNGVLFYWYGIPETLAERWEDEALWRAVNPASWVAIEDLRKQLNAPGFNELDFKRLHLNMWTAVRDSWLPTGAWAALRDPHWTRETEIPEGAIVYCGVDVALVHDTTAVAWAYRLPDGRILLRVEVFSAVDGVPAHRFVSGGRIDLEEIEDFILELAFRRGYRVRELVYDPRFFERSAQRLRQEGMNVAELPQGSAIMADAYQAFYAGVRDGSIAHDGDHVLAAHVEATGAILTDRGWKVRKLANSSRIDACVAAVMAHHRAVRVSTPAPPEIHWLHDVETEPPEEDEAGPIDEPS